MWGEAPFDCRLIAVNHSRGRWGRQAGADRDKVFPCSSASLASLAAAAAAVDALHASLLLAEVAPVCKQQHTFLA